MDKENKKETIILRTFAQTWDFDYVFYGIGDFMLPFPITMTQFIFFLVGFVICFLFSKIIPVFAMIPALVRYIVLPFAFMKGATKLDIDGKKPLVWIGKEILHIVADPKQLVKFEEPKEFKAFKFNPVEPIKIIDR